MFSVHDLSVRSSPRPACNLGGVDFLLDLKLCYGFVF